MIPLVTLSCLCTVHTAYHFAPRWRPRFVTALAPEDRCHLNGLAVAGGKPRFATALAETDCASGWRAMKVGGGCVIDVASNETVCRGMTMPHSPRLAGDRLLVLHSGLGELVAVEPAGGRWETIAALPGYTRGLAVRGKLAFIGLSKVRASSSQDGVPIAARPERLKCGFAVVDLSTGGVLANFEFVAGIDELFDVQVLPDACDRFWPALSPIGLRSSRSGPCRPERGRRSGSQRRGIQEPGFRPPFTTVQSNKLPSVRCRSSVPSSVPVSLIPDGSRREQARYTSISANSSRKGSSKPGTTSPPDRTPFSPSETHSSGEV